MVKRFPKKFKAIEPNAKNAPVKDIEWEGEEVGVESKTKLEEDKGIGQEIVLRFFDFVAQPEVFRQHQPTAQELFDVHRKSLEAMLWADGWAPYSLIEPRLLFSKDKKFYRFVIACIPSLGNTVIDSTRTLSELVKLK